MAEAAIRPGIVARVFARLHHHIPTRERIEANRYLRPVAGRILVPSLWRFNRRSVPRGVALGLFTGILFPFVHAPVAAVSALPVRANVPVAVATTLLHNPLTTVPIYYGAFLIGHWILHFDPYLGKPLAANVKANATWLHWLVAQGGPATIVGLIAMAIGLAGLGFVASGLFWRFRVARKWRARAHRLGPNQAN
ncbi:DUF2062 domain-containing protein [Sphingomonas psychrolutea]|uniref:DUF2062 domain-containing protein n=1 Tax=Sphingomonas psychrolutea TaxID=1259676 RepID=A0ABQ1GQ66_9SPHN|nr:DUF2062 domain-containing protein [Sphingomonas psychrolutea]GGA48288.1 hypothetical protein GCM10011395_18230 [Sphingomonas psychrolutea]